MLWPTLNAVRTSTKCEFAPHVAEAHHFVRLPSGMWTRTFGIPGLLPEQRHDLDIHAKSARVWHIVRVSP